jgi:hypothetical protein
MITVMRFLPIKKYVNYTDRNLIRAYVEISKVHYFGNYPLKKSGSMYSTIGSGTASQATPQGHHHKRAEVWFEMTI